MSQTLSILYRGPLASCNYACGYCPFAKRHDSAGQLAADRMALERLIAWIARQDRPIAVLFTPWGEGLIRPWYTQALATLTNLPHVRKAAIQTNLSCRLDWLDSCDTQRLALWCTYHPGQASRHRFLQQCRRLDERGVRYSVGIVGMKEHLPEIEAMRHELPSSVYLWVNAFKRVQGYYSPEDVKRIEAVDPLFRFSNARHPSLGRPCRCGRTVISVDGEGAIRRCHFIQETIGNLYEEDWEESLADRPCTNAVCDCHIGYVHMEDLGLYEVFGDGVLERIPLSPPAAQVSCRGA